MRTIKLFGRQVAIRALFCAVALALMLPHAARAESAAEDFEAFADSMLLALANDQGTPDDREAALRQAFIRGIDLEAIASFVLSDHSDEASAAQRRRFDSIYPEYLLGMLSRLMLDRGAKSLTVLETKQESETTSILSEVLLASGKRRKWLWLLHKSGATHRVIDIKTRGMSLASMLKVEVNHSIKRDGIEGYLVQLRQRL